MESWRLPPLLGSFWWRMSLPSRSHSRTCERRYAASRPSHKGVGRSPLVREAHDLRALGPAPLPVAYSQTGWAAASPGRAAATETFSDEVLILRIANGDQLAMRSLFGRHRLAIYRWLRRLVDDEALADDLLSDVFLDVWRKAGSFERRSAVSTWRLAIARHKALSARRRPTDGDLNNAPPAPVAEPADDPELCLGKKK